MERVIIYGLGYHFSKIVTAEEKILDNTVALCDKDKEKHGKVYYNKTIIAPEELKNYSYDKILVATDIYFEEIKHELIDKYDIGEKDILLADDYIEEPLHSGEYIELLKQIQDAGPLSNEAFKNCRVLAHRDISLDYMPKNAIVAEIGVAYGDFSKKILKQMQPKKFYAIDYFSQDDPFANCLGANYFKRDNMPHQEWYEHRLAKEIASCLVETRQGLSWDCLAEFDDNYFDYIYIDAAHDYESVCKDISMSRRKVKNGGYIQFNDYMFSPQKTQPVWGVVPAVNKFINSGKHQVEFLCLSERGCTDLCVKIIK